MRRITLALIISIAVVGFVLHNASARSNFVTIKLPKGISIDIPRNWKVATADQMITLDTTVEAQLDLTNSPRANSDLGFVAGYFDDAGDKAKVNVRYYPDMKVTQAVVKQADDEEIKKFDNSLRQRAAEAPGDAILHWGSTRKQDFQGRIALVTEYRRPPFAGRQGSFNVRLIRVLDGPRSFTLTVSYNESYAVLFKPICDKIVSSLKIGK